MKQQIILLVLLACALQLQAQLIIPRDTFRVQVNGEELQIVGAVVQSSEQLSVLDVPANRYPLFIMRHEVARQYFKVQNERDQQYRLQLDQLANLRHRDTLNMLEISKLRGIHDLQQQHIGLCEAHSARLNDAITTLDAQLTQTRNLAQDCNDARRRRQRGAWVLGGGIGFGIGILAGVLLTR
jgi:hypothetical protein